MTNCSMWNPDATLGLRQIAFACQKAQPMIVWIRKWFQGCQIYVFTADASTCATRGYAGIHADCMLPTYAHAE